MIDRVRWGWVLLGILGLIAYLGRSSSPTMPAKEAQGEITAARGPVEASLGYATLLEQYAENEIAADAKYKRRRIEVKGVVNRIAKDITGSPYLTMGDSLPSVQAVFPRTMESSLVGLRPGNLVRVTCTLRGKTINVILTDCDSIAPYVP